MKSKHTGFDLWRLLALVAVVAALVIGGVAQVASEPLPSVSKDYRYTDVCFERDNDGDGMFSEDPVDELDNDGDGLTDEDPIECPDGTSLGTPLPVDAEGKFVVEAVTKKNGRVSSYNPGQYYAVSTVERVPSGMTLSIGEYYGDCTDPEDGRPALSALNPPEGGGAVVIVEVVDGEALQIADAKSPNVTVTDSNNNGVPDDAHAVLGPVTDGTTILMYVKFRPGLKGELIPDELLECVNKNVAALGDDPEPPTFEASANLTVLPKP